MQGPSILNNIQAETLVISGTDAGWFLYSGTPGPGNSPIAYASSSSTDPYGNGIAPDAIVSAGLGYASLSQGILTFGQISPTPPSGAVGGAIGSSPPGTDGGLAITSGRKTGLDTQAVMQFFSAFSSPSGIQQIASDTVSAWQPGSSQTIPEAWHSYALINSFTGTLQYKLNNDNTVSVYGEVTTPAANFNFTTINTAPPSGYGAYQTPAIAPPVLGYDNATSTPVLLKAFGDGTLQFINAAASHLNIINGRYPVI